MYQGKAKFIFSTRMHSSRMCTARFSGRLHRGRSAHGFLRDVCLWVQGGLPLGQGGVHHTPLQPHFTTLALLSPHPVFTTHPLTTPLPEQNESQTGVKTLPSRNFVCGR